MILLLRLGAAVDEAAVVREEGVAEGADGQEVAEDVAGNRAADVRQATELGERNAGVGLEVAKQRLDGTSQAEESAVGAAQLLPGQHQGRVSRTVLVGHAQVSHVLVVLIGRQIGAVGAALDVDLQHRASADLPPSGGEGHRGAGVALGGGLDHVILLLAAYAGDASVVLYADEQPSAVGVGEGAEGAGDLLTVADLKLEVLPLVFAFCDQGFEGVHVHFN